MIEKQIQSKTNQKTNANAGQRDHAVDMTMIQCFSNYVEGGYEGMLVVRFEIKSMEQRVSGVAYIGTIAGPFIRIEQVH